MYSIADDEKAFDELYCIAFEMMDAQWLAKHASYMEFNVQPLSLYFFIFMRFKVTANSLRYCILDLQKGRTEFSSFFSLPLIVNQEHNAPLIF